MPRIKLTLNHEFTLDTDDMDHTYIAYTARDLFNEADLPMDEGKLDTHGFTEEQWTRLVKQMLLDDVGETIDLNEIRHDDFEIEILKDE